MTEQGGYAFIAPVQRWFERAFGEPTPPQALGWPPIQRGEHTLILSPTGSGKTLAAFLCGINDLYARLAAGDDIGGVGLLYVSPLKALNNDIERNLRVPLAGIRHDAAEMGQPLPPLRVMVRTGDTPQSVRVAMVRQPPHILITTPESLYLILTSARARDMLHAVRTVIVDEIHTLCGNKRGVHLALSLERLDAITAAPAQRIGLSATQRPLEEVARYLGGYAPRATPDGQTEYLPRPVTIVDAGTRKPLDLQVITAVRDLRLAPGCSIWSSIIPQALDQILRHRTTLIFTNSRRQAERTADRLNEQYRAEREEEVPPGSTEALSPGGFPKGVGFFGTGVTDGPFRAHHGSISRTARLKLEQDLKEGRLPALVGTSSLELGIDIGAVDLVLQLQSPKGVSRGLQRVGRSGHLVGQTSVGRIYPTHAEDVLESAAVAQGMLAADVEPTYTPQNCLDVLAQQIVAMVSVQEWDAQALYDVVRRAYPYHRLTWRAYEAVLSMLSGRYPSESFRELRPRLVWDRVGNRLAALPGSRLLALRNGGTIPDRGTFGVYLPDGATRLGELDEEFVFETRPGDVFTLGSQTWRVVDVTEDRVVVSDAAGQLPRMPFWRGDVPYRDYELGLRVGRLRRALAARVEALPPAPEGEDPFATEEAQALMRWLREEYALDENSARNAISYVQRQLHALGAISSDQTVILETFTDAVGDDRLVVHSCFGGRINAAWALALAHALREREGVTVEVQTSDDGILFRLPGADRRPPLDVIREMGPQEARERLLAELPNSALFGAQFRVNAARALLLPGVQGGRRRTPFWLQRLRAKDLLAMAKGFDDFPLIAETYRDCLQDILDLPHLEEMLGRIQSGEIRVVEAETIAPSPVAAELLFNFISVYMYEGDAPKLERQMQALTLDRNLLGELLDGVELSNLLRPEAVREVEGLVSRTGEGYRARTADELAALLLEMGDLTAAEVVARSEAGEAWLAQLAASGRALPLALPTIADAQTRWIAADHYALYRDAFGLPETPPAPLPSALLTERFGVDEARQVIVRRFLRRHGPVSRDEIARRYGFPLPWLEEVLAALEQRGEVVQGQLVADCPAPQVADRRVLEQMHQRTLALLRREIQPVSVMAYADLLARWQHLHPAERLSGPTAVTRLLQQLRAVSAPGVIWGRDILPLRLRDWREAELAALAERGEIVWVGAGGKDPRRAAFRLLFRGEGAAFLPPEPADVSTLSAEAQQVLAFLRSEGACFTADLERGLGLTGAALQGALVELVLAGLVTNDSVAVFRAILAQPPAAEGERAPLSALEAQLAEWRRQHPRAHLSRQMLQQAKQKAARRTAGTPQWPGRWSLVHRIGVWGRDLPPEERAARQARQLLARDGVVTRLSLVAESEWDWAAISRHLMLMEMRGEVRRGYFVRGLPGLQFATTEALEALRRCSAAEEDDALVLVNACDPAYIYGWDVDLPEAAAEVAPLRVSRVPTNYVVLRRGQPVLALGSGGERIEARADVSEETLRRAMRLFLEHVTAPGGLASSPRRVVVREWNGASPLGGAAQPLLEALNFHREPPHMVWDGR